MTWGCELTEDAEKDFQKLPRDTQRAVARVIDQMAADPFQGDVRALKGPEWKGVFRRRTGSYRIFFTVSSEAKIATIIRIVRRSEKTYARCGKPANAAGVATAILVCRVMGVRQIVLVLAAFLHLLRIHSAA